MLNAKHKAQHVNQCSTHFAQHNIQYAKHIKLSVVHWAKFITFKKRVECAKHVV